MNKEEETHVPQFEKHWFIGFKMWKTLLDSDYYGTSSKYMTANYYYLYSIASFPYHP